MSGTVLLFITHAYLMLIAPLYGKYCYLNFIEEKMEVKSGQIICPRSSSGKPDSKACT